MGKNLKTCKRWNQPWEALALTFSCFQGKPFLLSDHAKHAFADAMNQTREKYLFDIWAYVLMPNHIHIIIWPREETYSISSILKSVKQSVSRKVIGQLRKTNSPGLQRMATKDKTNPYRFWQDGGGYDRNIRNTAELREMMRYIHNNPVRKELVECAGEWYWSSFREWEFDAQGPIPIDKESCNRSLV